jgi:hypothetical protein
MPRIPNTRPTLIYWLVDTRPEVLSQYPSGKPFYCGKTVIDPQKRLKNHRYDASRYKDRPIAKRLSAVGDFIRIDIMDTVLSHEGWAERERFWIATIRHFYPDCVNVSRGGDGVPGLVHSAETRARISRAKKGCEVSLESRAKRSATQKGRVFSEEHRAKIKESRRGQIFSAEVRAKMSAAHVGKILPAEQRAKIGAKLRGRSKSAETRAKMKAAWVFRRIIKSVAGAAAL